MRVCVLLLLLLSTRCLDFTRCVCACVRAQVQESVRDAIAKFEQQCETQQQVHDRHIRYSDLGVHRACLYAAWVKYISPVSPVLKGDRTPGTCKLKCDAFKLLYYISAPKKKKKRTAMKQS